MSANYPVAQMLVMAWMAMLVLLAAAGLMRPRSNRPETPANPGTGEPA